MVYQAQSTEYVHLLLKMHEEVDDNDCSATHDHSVTINAEGVEVSVLCFESESDIKLYKRQIKLPKEIVPESSSFTWMSESRVHLELKKMNGPSYWPVLIDGIAPGKQQDVDKRVAQWRQMHNKYVEQVQDYMTVDMISDEL